MSVPCSLGFQPKSKMQSPCSPEQTQAARAGDILPESRLIRDQKPVLHLYGGRKPSFLLHPPGESLSFQCYGQYRKLELSSNFSLFQPELARMPDGYGEPGPADLRMRNLLRSALLRDSVCLPENQAARKRARGRAARYDIAFTALWNSLT